MLRTNPAVAQKVAASVVLPKFAYGLLSRMPPKSEMERLRAAIKVAMGIAGKAHSWEALCLFVVPAHLVDPFCKLATTHLMAVIRGLRQAETSDVELWDEVNTSHGPKKVAREIMETLAIIDSGKGQWDIAGQQMDILHEPIPKISHALREACRLYMIGQASRKRRHLGGIENVDRRLTARYTWKEGSPLRPWIIMLVSDAVWTQRKRFLAGCEKDSACPCCTAGVEEDLEHLFYGCEAWANHRRTWSECIPHLREESSCTRLCGVATKEMHPEVTRKWGEIQVALAEILHKRMAMRQEQEKPQRETAQQDFHPPPPNEGQGRLFDFPLVTRLHVGRHTWPYSREAWAEMCGWLATLKIDSEPRYHPNILELYLDFVGWMGGHRMLTEIGVAQRGDWISNQLDRFLQAVRSFQGLTRCQPIFPALGEPYLYVHWPKEWGFPKLVEGKIPLILPRVREARVMMESARSEIGGVDQDIHTTQVWRRWTPGLPGTQLHTHHRAEDIRWWRAWPTTRLRHKEFRPRWWHQRRDVERFYVSMEDRGWGDIEVGGVSMSEWLMEQGCTSLQDLLATVSVARATAKRAATLHRHNRETKSGHLVPLWQARNRPRCMVCGGEGYASATAAFLRQECSASGSIPGKDLHALLKLELEHNFFDTRASHALRLARR